MIQTLTLYGPILRLTPFNLAGSMLRFSINRRDDSRQVGLLLVTALDPKSGHAALELLIADPAKRKLYGPEVLKLVLQFGFCERKLHRVTMCVPEFDRVTLKLIEQIGFTLEVCQRQAILLRGRFWDDLVYGLLETDWQDKVEYEASPLPVEGYC